MKKLCFFVLLIVLIIVLFPQKQSDVKSLVSPYAKSDTQVCFFTTSEIINEELVENVVNCGNVKIVSCEITKYNKVKNNLNDIDGISFKLNASFNDFKKISREILSYVVKVEELSDGIAVVYGANKMLKNSISIDNKLVNLQLAYNSGVVTIGSPIILGSY